MPSQLTVSRTVAEKDVQQRQVILTLDGDPFATLLFGESETRAITTGQHRLRAWNTWAWKTIQFQAAENEHINFRVINRAGSLTWWMMAVFGAGPMYITLEREP